MKSDYIEQYKIVHNQSESFGTSSIEFLHLANLIIQELQPGSILDYGCGKSSLIEELDINKNTKKYRYDPAIEEYSVLPVDRVDLIINTDVLEHIPEEHLDEILNNISGISENVFFNISNRLASQRLPNGENAHCTVKPPEWWENRLEKHFNLVQRLVSADKTASMFITFKTPPLFRLKFNFYSAMARFSRKIKGIRRVFRKIFF